MMVQTEDTQVMGSAASSSTFRSTRRQLDTSIYFKENDKILQYHVKAVERCTSTDFNQGNALNLSAFLQV